uniref:Uncharacterized protein n=1 Tax=Anopheles culicifacies TaxID=139723 RepID=A0A182M918_9DIPT
MWGNPEKAPSSNSASIRFEAITIVSRLVLEANAPDWMRCKLSAPEMDTLRKLESPKNAPSGITSKSFCPIDSSSSRTAQMLQTLERTGLYLVQRVQAQVQLGQQTERSEGRCRNHVDRIIVQMQDA